MKKIINLIGLTVLVFLISGCDNKKLEKYYENMLFNNINSYTMDLRIYGTYNNENVNEMVRIINYKNEQLTILASPDMENIFESNIYNNQELILEDKLYKLNEDYTYTELNNELVYKNTEIYLKSVSKLNEIISESTEKVGEKEYKVYEVEYKKDIIKEVLSETNYKDYEINDKITGKVYIDGENIYKIEIKLKDLTINASYFGVNAYSKKDINIETAN